MAPTTIIKKVIYVGGGSVSGAGPHNRWPNKVTKAKSAKEKKHKEEEEEGCDGGGPQRGKKDINAMSFDALNKEV